MEHVEKSDARCARVIGPWLAVLVAAALALGLPAGQAVAGVLRLAVVAGRNEGSPDQPTLRYAERDAARFASLLVELGGFRPEDVWLATAATPQSLTYALEQARAAAGRQADAGGSSILVVYVSGHADGVNLELGGVGMAFADLRKAVEEIPATLRIAIVDSCLSGRLVAAKGGAPGPDFDLSLDDALEVDGLAVLTSSAASELAQESDELSGSFFTHHLLSGLRGAADVDADRRVTLDEAYRYAYERTVRETSRTLTGAQHPSYEYRVQGRGEVVLTDLSRPDAALAFDQALEGAFHVIDRESDAVVAEVVKEKGVVRRLALRNGLYAVGERRRSGYVLAEVALRPNRELLLTPASFAPGPDALSLAKGGRPAVRVGLVASQSVGSPPLTASGVLLGGSFGVRFDLGRLSLVPRLDVAGTSTVAGGLPYDLWTVGVGTLVAWRFPVSVVDLLAGVDVAGRYEWQRLVNGEVRSGPTGAFGATLGASFRVAPRWTIDLFATGGDYLFVIEGSLQQRAWWIVRTGLGLWL